MIEELIRPHLKNFQPYSSARSEMSEGGILLDANELSLGSPVSLDGIVLNRYPDPYQYELRKKLAARMAVSPDSVFVGVGSDEVIDLLVRLFCEPSKEGVAILEPTYGVYRVAAELNAVEVTSVELDDAFQIDVEKTLRAVSSTTKLLFCCSPNNPTGNRLRREDLLELSRSFKGVMIVDEAYVEFSNATSMVHDVVSMENLVVLRTLSKAWGLAGIRLGYCVAEPILIEHLLRIKSPYNISAVTSALALKALGMDEFVERSTNTVIAERERLGSALSKLPIVQHVYPSETNFLLVRFQDAERAFSALLKNGIVVRRRSEPRLHNCLRLTVGTPQENRLLLKILSEVK